MTVDYYSEVEVDFDFDHEKIANTVVSGVLEDQKFPYEAYVSLMVTSADEVQSINMENRGIDAPTDVLSFPAIDMGEYPDGFDELALHEELFYPDTDEIMLGDIVLCYERVISQAAEYGHSKKREFAFLIAHSMLHLLGYDHEEEDERIKMEEIQKRILNSLNITREE